MWAHFLGQPCVVSHPGNNMGSEDLCLNQTFFLLTQIKFGFCLVLSPTAYVVPAQIKVKEGFSASTILGLGNYSQNGFGMQQNSGESA